MNNMGSNAGVSADQFQNSGSSHSDQYDMITDVISYDFNNLYGSGLMFSLLKYFNILILTLTVMR